MIKKNMKKCIISSILILLPILAGLIFWNRLPDSMTTHFGADGNPDGTMGKAIAVFVLPLILLAVHWLCLLGTHFDKNQKGQNKKALGMIFWIMPAISFFVNATMYCVALDYSMSVGALTFALMGVLFIAMGNYLPKTKQNRTLGIKISWTLDNEENWNKTHRFGGKVWVVCGAVTLVAVFLPLGWGIAVAISAMLAAAILPIVYSYTIYKSHKKEGVNYSGSVWNKTDKKIGTFSIVAVSLILAGVAVLMVTGDIEYTYGEKELTVVADFYEDVSVAYADMDSVSYEEVSETAYRTMGFGSPRLSMGVFQNDTHGSHTRYTYTQNKAVVVIKVEDKVLIINGQTPEETEEIYEALLEKVN